MKLSTKNLNKFKKKKRQSHDLDIVQYWLTHNCVVKKDRFTAKKLSKKFKDKTTMVSSDCKYTFKRGKLVDNKCNCRSDKCLQKCVKSYLEEIENEITIAFDATDNNGIQIFVDDTDTNKKSNNQLNTEDKDEGESKQETTDKDEMDIQQPPKKLFTYDESHSNSESTDNEHMYQEKNQVAFKNRPGHKKDIKESLFKNESMDDNSDKEKKLNTHDDDDNDDDDDDDDDDDEDDDEDDDDDHDDNEDDDDIDDEDDDIEDEDDDTEDKDDGDYQDTDQSSSESDDDFNTQSAAKDSQNNNRVEKKKHFGTNKRPPPPMKLKTTKSYKKRKNSTKTIQSQTGSTHQRKYITLHDTKKNTRPLYIVLPTNFTLPERIFKDYNTDNQELFNTYVNDVFCANHVQLKEEVKKNPLKKYVLNDHIENIVFILSQKGTVVKYDTEKKELFEVDDQLLYQTIKKKCDNVSTRKEKKDKKKPIVHLGRKKALKKLYDSRDLLTLEQVKGWNHYSVIQTLYTSWYLYVYPFTHRVKKDTPIHSRYLYKLKFPESPSLFIVFHGRLVHRGAESKFVQSGSSQVSHDGRLFSYVKVRDTEPSIFGRETRTGEKGKEGSGLIYTDIRDCGTAGCKKCKGSLTHGMYKEIDLGEIYKMILGERKHTKTSCIKFKVFGDLDEDGFSVWFGLDSRSFFHEGTSLRSTISRFEMSNKTKWKGISSTQRKALTVFGDTLDNNPRPPVFKAFIQKLRDFLNENIFGSRYVEITKSAILNNRGDLDIQSKHRDHDSSE